MTPQQLRKPVTVYLIGFLAYFVFSMGDTLIKIAASDYAFTVVFAISTSAGCLPVLGYLIFKRSISKIATNNYLLHLARGILMTAVAYSILKGIILLPLSIAYPILLSAPVFLSIMGVIFLNEKINIYKILSLITAMSGVILISGFSFNQGYNKEGIILLLIGSILVAVLDLTVRLFGEKETTISLSFYNLFFAAIIFILLSLNSWEVIENTHLLQIISGGFLDGIGMLLLVFALKNIEASYASITHYSQIIYGLIIGIFIFNHTPSFIEIIGSMLIILSGYLIYFKLNQSN
ncbi:DMT family transporter [Alphaproteobacteria bacterium]|nr:DMT family transporter [Alphaproteobacteria bacterium]